MEQAIFIKHQKNVTTIDRTNISRKEAIELLKKATEILIDHEANNPEQEEETK